MWLLIIYIITVSNVSVSEATNEECIRECLVKLVYTTRVSYAHCKSMWASVSDHWSEKLPYAHSIPSINSPLRKSRKETGFGVLTGMLG